MYIVPTLEVPRSCSRAGCSGCSGAARGLLVRDCSGCAGELAEPKVISAWARAASLLTEYGTNIEGSEFNY